MKGRLALIARELGSAVLAGIIGGTVVAVACVVLQAWGGR